MHFNKDTRPDGIPTEIGEVLAEAMPWIKNVTGKTIVIKYGGAAMENEDLKAQVMADIVLLKIIGVNPVLVHGGGKAISAAMKNADFPVEFVDGQRVTTPEVMDLVRQVLTGKVNQELVTAMNKHGNMAVGISGADARVLVAEQLRPELGRVGQVTHVNTQLVEDLVKSDYIPVIASIAIGEDGGAFNINADVAAGHVAAAIGAHKIIYLTDVDGLYKDFDDKDSLISNMTLEEARAMIALGELSTGMIPKIGSCITAMEAGVQRAHIINGTIPHGLLLETLTDKGIGTMIYTEEEIEPETELQPLGNFASKLL